MKYHLIVCATMPDRNFIANFEEYIRNKQYAFFMTFHNKIVNTKFCV